MDKPTSLYVSYLVGLAVGCGVGGCCGYQYAADRERGRAVEARVGRWESDAATGLTIFVYGCVRTAEKGTLSP